MKLTRALLVLGAAGAISASAAPAYALPATATGWAQAFKAQPVYGDGMASCDLGSGRRVFVTGDAVPRDGSAWAHSTITVASGSTARVLRPGYAGVSPYQVIPAEPGGWHWLGPCAAVNGRLFVLAPRVAPTAEWPYFVSVGNDLAVFRYTATTDPVFERVVSVPATGGVAWSAGLTATGGYLWAFGSSTTATDGWTGHDVYAARVAPSVATSPAAWRGWTGAGYGVVSKSVPVLTGPRDGGTETVVSVARLGGVWKMTSRLGGAWGSGAVAEWSTPALGKPWTRSTIATVPDNAYIAWKHYGVMLADGRVPLTYNTPGTDATWTSVAP